MMACTPDDDVLAAVLSEICARSGGWLRGSRSEGLSDAQAGAAMCGGDFMVGEGLCVNDKLGSRIE